MDPRVVEFHPEAVLEARAARRWYEEVSPELAEAFTFELDEAISGISESPERWSRYLHGTHHYLLKRFPYVVVYRYSSERVQVLAVAHAKRKPGYWKKRLPK